MAEVRRRARVDDNGKEVVLRSNGCACAGVAAVTLHGNGQREWHSHRCHDLPLQPLQQDHYTGTMQCACSRKHARLPKASQDAAADLALALQHGVVPKPIQRHHQALWWATNDQLPVGTGFLATAETVKAAVACEALGC